MIRALLAKDLRVLRRSPALLGLIVIYPLLIAVGLGLTLTREPSPPKVAVVNLLPKDGSGTVEVGGQKISIKDLSGSLAGGEVQAHEVDSRETAVRLIQEGKIDGALVIPADAASKLTDQLTTGGVTEGPKLEVLFRSSGPLDGTLVRALLASRLRLAERALASEIVRVAGSFLTVLRDGGTVDLLGIKVRVLGLQAAEIIVRGAEKSVPANQRNGLEQTAKFAQLARENLNLSDKILQSIASPLHVTETSIGDKHRTLSGFAVGVAAALALMLVAMTLGAGMLASEREEGTMRRLLRGGRGAWRVATAKTLAAGIVAALSGLLLLVGVAAFGATPWSSAAWWFPATLLGGIAFAAFGVLLGAALRDARAATLAAILLAVPVAVIALIPAQAVGNHAHQLLNVISVALPFSAARNLLDAAVATQPDWAAGGQLLAQVVAYTALAGVIVRRTRT
jgi:ABC-2 type transport system permease protein